MRRLRLDWRPGSPGPTVGKTTIYAAADGSLKQVAEDGTESDLGGASPGGSQPGTVDAVNGLVADYDPGSAAVLIVDPRPQVWQPNTLYGASVTAFNGSIRHYVHKTGDPDVTFYADIIFAGRTGSVEPAWDSAPVDDNEIRWDGVARLTIWAWQAESAPPDPFSACVRANGCVFQNSGVSTSGTEEPDWASAPNYTDTVADGDGSWANVGVDHGTWSESTRYARNFVDATTGVAGAFFVEPTTPDGFLYALDSFLTRYVTSGPTEPIWNETVAEFTLDGDIVWQADTADSTNLLALTGIVAPADQKTLRIVHGAPAFLNDWPILLTDESNVEGTYGADVASAEANRLAFDGSDVTIIAGTTVLLVYAGERWQRAAEVL